MVRRLAVPVRRRTKSRIVCTVRVSYHHARCGTLMKQESLAAANKNTPGVHKGEHIIVQPKSSNDCNNFFVLFLPVLWRPKLEAKHRQY